MVFVTVSAGYTAAAALAGVATIAELSRAGRSVLEIFGIRNKPITLLQAAERTFNCHLWSGFKWHPCVLGMAGDLLVLSGRFVEEARLMESAHVSVQDFYASVALMVGDPLQLCFASAEEALSFAMEVRQRASLKKDMMKLADQAKDLRENGRNSTGRLSRGSTNPQLAAEEAAATTAALRTRLAVPKGVPMYTLSPSASGDLEKIENNDLMKRGNTPQWKLPALAVPTGVPTYALTPCVSGDLEQSDEGIMQRGNTPQWKLPTLTVPTGVPTYALTPCVSGDLEQSDEGIMQRGNTPQWKLPTLAVPTGVPTYALTPCVSGDLEQSDEGIMQRGTTPHWKAPETANLSRQNSINSTNSSNGHDTPKLKINRANSCPSPSKLGRMTPPPTAKRRASNESVGSAGSSGSSVTLRRHSETTETLTTSPRDPDSFASKVFAGLGLDLAKASLVAQKRVDVLKTKFEAKGPVAGR